MPLVRPKSKIGMVALGATVQVSLPPPKRFDRPRLIVPATAVSDILGKKAARAAPMLALAARSRLRSEEHTSELQSLMRISYAVFCLKKNTNTMQQIRANEQ